MPIKQKDWAKILQGIGIAGQTISGMQQLKEIQERQKVEDTIRNLRLQKLQSEIDAIPETEKARERVDTLLKIANMQGPMSVPFPEGGGGVEYTPPPSGILSEANNVELEKAYEKAYGKSLPEHLRIKEKPFPSASELLKERKAQGELGVMPLLPSQMDEPTVTKRTIDAYMRQAEGKASAEDLLWIAKYPMPTPPENYEIDGVRFSIIRNIIDDAFPVERDFIGQPTGRRMNLPEPEQQALLGSNPIPMYKYVAGMWKKEQELAKALSK